MLPSESSLLPQGQEQGRVEAQRQQRQRQQQRLLQSIMDCAMGYMGKLERLK